MDGERRRQKLSGTLRRWVQVRPGLDEQSNEKMKLDSQFQLSCTHFLLLKMNNTLPARRLSPMGSAHRI